jgi:6-phosphogluconate dehydrogenase
MVRRQRALDTAIGDLCRISPGDIIIDGGNSYYVDDLVARRTRPEGIHYLDVGTSGVWGRERGYCLMIGARRRR